jgi:hypothetical protein
MSDRYQQRADVPHRHFLGLDLGQQSDPSALAVAECTEQYSEESQEWETFFAIRYLRRWQLRTSYVDIVRDTLRMVRSPKLSNPTLTVDRTGVGAAACDLIREARPNCALQFIHITSGSAAHVNEFGTWLVPKKDLVAAIQIPLQAQRLKIANLPERATLEKELLNFKVRVTQAGNEEFGEWRTGKNDDEVLAVALALWSAAREGVSIELPEPPTLRTPLLFSGRTGQPVMDPREAGRHPWQNHYVP